MYDEMSYVKESHRRKNNRIMMDIPTENNIFEDDFADTRYFNGWHMGRSIRSANVAKG